MLLFIPSQSRVEGLRECIDNNWVIFFDNFWPVIFGLILKEIGKKSQGGSYCFSTELTQTNILPKQIN
jgi:hypothetical protein